MPNQEHFDRAKEYQEYYDSALREVGVRAPAPVLGQSANEYRGKTLHAIQRATLPKSHPLYPIDCRVLTTESLQALEPQILAASKQERLNPANVPPGQLKPVKVFDEYGKHSFTQFIGQESFVKQLSRAGRRVLSFATGDGRIYDAPKATWR